MGPHMKTILVLAMHGAPPNDFPKNDLVELMSLHNQLEHATSSQRNELQRRYTELEAKIRCWPRTAANDPFYAGSTALARQLEEVSKLSVLLGFNEFCAPSLEETLEQAACISERILVITPMMTRGGEHSEHDIPNAIQRVQGHHSSVEIRYIWPFDLSSIAKFLAEQVKAYL
jgi:sirohydrochlorin cobaltochelatase